MLIGQTGNHRPDPTISRPEPLGPDQRRQLDAVVAELAPGWSVEFRYDALDTATIVILPERRDDVSSPTLFIRRDRSAFHIEEVRWGTCRKLDDFPAWADVLRAVRIRLVWDTPFPTTLTDQRC